MAAAQHDPCFENVANLGVLKMRANRLDESELHFQAALKLLQEKGEDNQEARDAKQQVLFFSFPMRCRYVHILRCSTD